MGAAKRVLRYVKATHDYGICMVKMKMESGLGMQTVTGLVVQMI